MPFKYIIKWRRHNLEKVSVEAYHKYPKSEQEKRKPAFIIGQAEGAEIIAIRHMLEKAAKKFPTRKYGKTIHIILNESDPTAYETAYRIGLAAALINKAQTPQEVKMCTRYIENAMPEEIWFWTSKLLDEEIGVKALDALAILSGAKQASVKPSINQNAQRQNQQKGTFWPIVRHLMIEKAIQLYVKDHPQPEKQPEMKELKQGGYMSLAKKIVLKELNQQRKIGAFQYRIKMQNA
jgi:hypothetical protein